MLKYCIMNQMQHDGKRNVRLLRLQRLPYRVTARSYSRFRSSLPLTKSEIPHHSVVWNDRLGGVTASCAKQSLFFQLLRCSRKPELRGCQTPWERENTEKNIRTLKHPWGIEKG